MATTQDFNPDAHPESTSCDGEVGYSGAAGSFSSVRNGSGVNNGDSIAVMTSLLTATTTSNEYGDMTGLIILFDISGLPAKAVVTGVDLKLTPNAGPITDFDQLFSVVELTTKTGGDTGVDGADYDSTNRSSTELLNSPPLYSDFSSGVQEVMAFNQDGIDFVEGVNQGGGIVRLACGHRGWTRGFEPTWSSGATDELNLYTAETGTASNRPILTITYVIGETVDETLNMGETLTATPTLYRIIDEAVNMVESLTPGVGVIVDEAVNMVQAITGSPTIEAVVNEAINMVESVSTGAALIIAKIIRTTIRGTRIFQSYIQRN